jgi:hypothetical protein
MILAAWRRLKRRTEGSGRVGQASSSVRAHAPSSSISAATSSNGDHAETDGSSFTFSASHVWGKSRRGRRVVWQVTAKKCHTRAPVRQESRGLASHFAAHAWPPTPSRRYTDERNEFSPFTNHPSDLMAVGYQVLHHTNGERFLRCNECGKQKTGMGSRSDVPTPWRVTMRQIRPRSCHEKSVNWAPTMARREVSQSGHRPRTMAILHRQSQGRVDRRGTRASSPAQSRRCDQDMCGPFVPSCNPRYLPKLLQCHLERRFLNLPDLALYFACCVRRRPSAG